MSQFPPEVEAALRDLTAQIEAQVPVVGQILAEARASGLSEVEAMSRLMLAVKDRPEVARQIEELASRAFASMTRAAPEPAPLPVTPEATDIVLPPRREGGLPRINPLYSAALQERAQFDGDIPELRTGPMPQEARPAVPVATSARDAVAIGWMLDTAQAEVAAEVREIERQAAEEVRLLVEDPPEGTTALAASDPAVLARLDRANLPDPVGYERGKLPALREVEVPEAPALASLTPEQRGQLAWQFLSTTQGRRSATGAILDLVATGLRSDGFDVEVHRGPQRRVRPEEVAAYGEWVVDMAGPHSTQPGFAFVDTAARVLVKKLETVGGIKGYTADDSPPLVLEVAAVNTVDVRRVGWAARLTLRETV